MMRISERNGSAIVLLLALLVVSVAGSRQGQVAPPPV
jgi:hypothetical protein